ncbi:hypothetical protein A2899_03260 [Candidatus Amesbacteria bacterium RIFCSPLOWO2_01_FULL_49_25]|uniref:ABC transporter domain-containing protein n=1 Tax=Candidatus Amesbacteria bacterium RIFCSPHIGHO2_01_FULL_48_32b TaxID=1797253 RepID=A0A1F4YCD2_9BACT|nr:MAG: hypothetical protein A2876_03730 [Candidatus Amesbacteria bacterium RIFCSPHIGHO2_01_FULL_48_32b]OGD06864.1 MAG: hypothetical protein A2899_03260 [Candidatus Amesbacteria bacterium RIFCSPLOWO2_01_FULL_49_25]
MKKNFSALAQIIFILKFAAKFLWETNKKTFLIVVFLNALVSLFIIPNLLLDKAFLDILVSNIKSPQPLSAFRAILWIVAARFALQALRSLANRFAGYYSRVLSWEQNQRAEVMIGTKYATIAVPTLEDPDFKDRYQKIERESLNRLQGVANNFISLPRHLTGVISSLSFFIVTQPFVVLTALVSLVPAIIVERVFVKKNYELESQISLLHRFRGMYYYYLGRTRSYLELRLLHIHEHLGLQIKKYWQKIIDKRKAFSQGRRTWTYLAGLVDDAVSYSFDGLFAFQAIVGKISIGSAQAYIRAISNFKQSFTALTGAILELYENYLYLTDLVWFLELDNPYYNTQGRKLTPPFKGGITFKDVWFKYPDTENWILKGVTFQISPRENIALVGKNGAGKTTLVKLLCGFYKPDKGQILVNNTPVQQLNKPQYWKYLSVLFQDSDAFGITVKEIVSASDIAKSENLDKIKEYTRVSQIDSWIESLPHKYANPIGRDFKDGVSPSSGQWQRIGIARALFKDPEVLVLDEPTSNVDPEAEEQIFNEILDIGRKKIIIFISHRFSTVRRADRILVIDQGLITEEGSHDQLMARQGTYSRLFHLQAKSYK